MLREQSLCDPTEGKSICLGKGTRPFQEREELRVWENTCFRNSVVLIHLGLCVGWVTHTNLSCSERGLYLWEQNLSLSLNLHVLVFRTLLPYDETEYFIVQCQGTWIEVIPERR